MDAALYPKHGHTNNFNLMAHLIDVCSVGDANSSRAPLGALHVVFESDARHFGNKALPIAVNAAVAASDAATLTIIQQTHRTSNHELSICKQRCHQWEAMSHPAPHPHIPVLRPPLPGRTPPLTRLPVLRAPRATRAAPPYLGQRWPPAPPPSRT